VHFNKYFNISTIIISFDVLFSTNFLSLGIENSPKMINCWIRIHAVAYWRRRLQYVRLMLNITSSLNCLPISRKFTYITVSTRISSSIEIELVGMVTTYLSCYVWPVHYSVALGQNLLFSHYPLPNPPLRSLIRVAHIGFHTEHNWHIRKGGELNIFSISLSIDLHVTV
jgi:hypothetical protein